MIHTHAFTSCPNMKLLKNVEKLMTCGCRPYFISRLYSSQSSSKSVLKYVFISKSTNIFENLALEDWLYENYDLSKREILLLWRNTPAVVIGRHQNPWLESNVEENLSRNISIVRRNSGGGTVYHDLGNLNLSFLTERNQYSRVHNLEIIVRSLRKEWGIDSKINSRSDIMVKSRKISGTASKLSRKNAYHHCTILVDVNKHLLSTSLQSPIKNAVLDSKATASKPTRTINLKELDSSITVNRLMTVVGLEYLSTSRSNIAIESRGFHFVTPSNKYFSGLDTKIRTFDSWEWIYARTPKFEIIHPMRVDNTETAYTIHFQIKIEAGVIKNISVKYPQNLKLSNNVNDHFNTLFSGKNYSEPLLNQLERVYYDTYYCETSRFKIQ